MSVDYDAWLEEQMKDPEFRAEYEALDAEETLIQSLIEARKSAGLTQEELAEKSGVKQSELMELENGQAEPTLRLLQQLAQGMGRQVKLVFEPA